MLLGLAKYVIYDQDICVASHSTLLKQRLYKNTQFDPTSTTMKLLSTLVASTLALAVSVQATDCTEGMKYCQSVLIDIGKMILFISHLL
ncbi:hypothetical protein RIB2604_01503500 [Aspergillus luchuensis]|uniref:Uncharacterized protein n=1 Tax=Aspergillus kawachii TaxID=1069201 RepID=A0A146F8H6_ASPKA|nr:hypothetical protein RIB2604_01503500 [Aspergillus luchuensis]